ncbi:hypothetical protein Unana1_02391 [Umbelopsis nana]
MTLNREPNVHQEVMERSEIATVGGTETHLDNVGAPANDFEEIKAVMSTVLKPSPHPDQSLVYKAVTWFFNHMKWGAWIDRVTEINEVAAADPNRRQLAIQSVQRPNDKDHSALHVIEQCVVAHLMDYQMKRIQETPYLLRRPVTAFDVSVVPVTGFEAVQEHSTRLRYARRAASMIPAICRLARLYPFSAIKLDLPPDVKAAAERLFDTAYMLDNPARAGHGERQNEISASNLATLLPDIINLSGRMICCSG